MEYLEENLEEWMSAELDGYGDEDYLVFDCPGQVGVCVVVVVVVGGLPRTGRGGGGVEEDNGEDGSTQQHVYVLHDLLVESLARCCKASPAARHYMDVGLGMVMMTTCCLTAQDRPWG
jgi:hypothetical protein